MMEFMQGAITVCFAFAGLFFLRFWKETRDWLFLFFALSFWIQAATRITLWLVNEQEDRAYLYLVRLLAFALILIGIVTKNLSRKTQRQ